MKIRLGIDAAATSVDNLDHPFLKDAQFLSSWRESDLFCAFKPVSTDSVKAIIVSSPTKSCSQLGSWRRYYTCWCIQSLRLSISHCRPALSLQRWNMHWSLPCWRNLPLILKSSQITDLFLIFRTYQKSLNGLLRFMNIFWSTLYCLFISRHTVWIS